MSNKADKAIANMLEYPQATRCKEGVRFYVTDTAQTASQYGRCILSWTVTEDFMKRHALVRKPIDERYLVGLATYEQCSVSGYEYALTQRQADELAIEAISTNHFTTTQGATV